MAETSGFKFWRFFVSAKGRIGRVPFAVTAIPLWIFMYIWKRGLAVMANHMVVTHGIFQPDWWFALVVFSMIFDLFCLWVLTALTAKRLHDVGRSGKWALLVPIQYIALFAVTAILYPVGVSYGMSSEAIEESVAPYRYILLYFKYALWAATAVLCFIPGNKLANRFGPPTSKTDLPLA